MLPKSRLMASSALRVAMLAGALMVPSAAISDTVSLKSADGTVNLQGEFVSFEDNTYVIRTGLGELRISAARVRCEGAACPQFETASADVVIAGSDTVGLGLMPLLLEGYAGFLDADATFTSTSVKDEIIGEFIGDQGFGDEIGSFLVSSTTSGDSFKKLGDKSTEIGMASRRIKPAEARALRDAGAGNMIDPDNEHIIAVDSLVVITHPSNPVKSLTMAQLAGIYAGEITNWREVGGPNLQIEVFDRQQGSGTRSVFAKSVFDGENVSFSGAQPVDTNTEMATAVNASESAIGFVSYAFQRGAKPLNLVNECGITMTPDVFSARTEEYALQRRLYLYTRSDTVSDASRDFLEYVESENADGVIQKSGFIGLGIDRRTQPLDGDRARALLDSSVDAFEGQVMREMLGSMVEHDRLSTTFRFATGSSRLDERGILDMQRLASYLESQPSGTKVTFVGFTDDVGAFESNRALSERRSAQVMEQMADFASGRLGGIEMASAGYGEVAPSACNVNEDGRRINRRVEVWIQNPNAS